MRRLALAAAVAWSSMAGIGPAMAMADASIRPAEPVRRGTVAWFYATTTAPDAIYPACERIFDGERWIMLSSEAGWRLYIESQRGAADSE